METIKEISNLLVKVKEKKPIIHHITNFVTMNDSANIALAIGGSPLMAFDENEVIDAVNLASCLVINIGTLNSNNYNGILLAAKRANEINIPIILDPVGVGLSKYRLNLVDKLLRDFKISIIRGNMLEIGTLAGMNFKNTGIDSYIKNEDGKGMAKSLSKKLNSIIAITGEIDIISDGVMVYSVHNGTNLLSKVTGTGCMTTSLIGAYSGITDDYLLSTIAGIMTMGVSGELALESLNEDDGIGTFKVKLFDSIYNLKGEILIKRGKLILE